MNELRPEIKWKIKLGEGAVFPKSVYDINLDGSLEIISSISPGEWSPPDSTRLVCTSGTNGNILWNSPSVTAINFWPWVVDTNSDKFPEILVGSSQGGLKCLKGIDGQIKWESEIGDTSSSALWVCDTNNNNKLEIISGSEDGFIYCLSGINGEIIWKVATGSGVSTSPWVADLDDDGELEIIIGSEDKSLYCISATNGEIKWITPTEGPIIDSFPRVYDINNNGNLEILVGSRDKHMYCISGTNGKINWVAETPHEVLSSPWIADINGNGEVEILFTSQSLFLGPELPHLYCIEGKYGRVRWTMSDSNIGNFWIVDIDKDNKLEILTAGGGSISCYSGTTQVNKWQYFLGGNDGTLWVADIDGDGMLEILYGSSNGILYCLGHGPLGSTKERNNPVYAANLGISVGKGISYQGIVSGSQKQTIQTTKPIQSQLKEGAESTIHILSGYDSVGEHLKLAVKVSNTERLTINSVSVVLDVPDGLEFTKDTSPYQKLGHISGSASQSAIFWLKPLRCIDDEYSGTVIFRDAENNRHTIPIRPKRIVNICPMLVESESVDETLMKLKTASLSRNCTSFDFVGPSKMAMELAESRLSGLKSINAFKRNFENNLFLGYALFIGKTKYGKYDFAAEIQVSGTNESGLLTITVYSDEKKILSGFFVDITDNLRNHLRIIEERFCPTATCPKCAGNLEKECIDTDGIFICPYCGTLGKAPIWLK